MAAKSQTIAEQQRLIEIVEAAAALPEDQRLAYIDSACVEAPRLRRWAESLLPSQLEMTGFLPKAPNCEIELPAPPATGLAAVPEYIGSYRLLELLGEGGMGSVYLAEQTEPIQRQVAVKVTRARPDQRKLMYRFEVERQALARMSHPNIAQVYEAGDLPDGRPYFVMEHVPGVSLLRYCDRGRLSIERRLELFLDVCAGIHHAHQKGVLHRDVKPENVLVTEQSGLAVPKIIDFGIAKTLDATIADPSLRTGDVLLGTPAFVSPELFSDKPEISADADIRSDVYALGVLLYILLVGELPFERQEESVLGFMRRMSEFDAPPPSRRLATLPSRERWHLATDRDATPLSLTRRLQGDLDRVVLKAIARKRDDRYGSAAELANDLRRHLADEPIGAVRPRRQLRMVKLMRRYPLAAAALLVLASGMVSGLSVYHFQGLEARRQADAAERRQAEATRTIHHLLTLLQARSGQPPIEDTSSDAATDKATEDPLLQELLEADVPGLGGDSAVDPALRLQLLVTLGELCNQVGLPERARVLLEQARQLQNAEPELSVEQRQHTLDALAASTPTPPLRAPLPASLLPELPVPNTYPIVGD